VAAFTPTDAAHVLGKCAHWNREAAEVGALLWLRRLKRFPADSAAAGRFAEDVLERMTVQAGESIASYLLESDHAGQPVADGWRDLRLVREALRRSQPAIFASGYPWICPLSQSAELRQLTFLP